MLLTEVLPPTGLESNSTAEAIAVTGMIGALIALAVWSAYRREWMLPIMLAGAAAASLVEAQLDILSRIWWAEDLVGSYSYAGVHVPLFATLGYSLLVGGGTYSTYRIIRGGATREQILKLAVVFFVVESAFEMIWVGFDLYAYYGPQPMEVFGFPLYWGVVNTVGAMTAGYVVYRVAPHLRGAQLLLLGLIPPLSFGADFAVSWPTWAAIQAGGSSLVLSFVALITIALCALELWIVCGAVERGGRVDVQPGDERDSHQQGTSRPRPVGVPSA